MKTKHRNGSQRSLWSELGAGLEWATLRLSPVYYGLGVPHGGGDLVVVVPGFLGTDATLLELRLWLGRMGYRPYGSGIGWNAECPDVLLDRLEATIDRAHDETGRKVRLIGHSLGGLLARAAAVRKPDQVSHVITLGTPFRRLDAHPKVKGLLRKVLRRRRRARPHACTRAFFAALRRCPCESVSEASIYSKNDPIVDWRDSIATNGGRNIEVDGSHVGLPVNAQVYRDLAGLLATPEPARVPVPLPRRENRGLPLAA